MERYADALEQLAGCLAVPALRDRGDMADLRRRAHAAHAACHLNLAAVGLKARCQGCVTVARFGASLTRRLLSL